MPAIDRCEPQVVRALEKAGWVVTDQPYVIHIGEEKAYVYADLQLRHVEREESIIVVEVKCFARRLRMMQEFEQAIGQIVLYRYALALNRKFTPLYLVVPLPVYETFFQKPLPHMIIGEEGIKMIVVDLATEEIVLWSH